MYGSHYVFGKTFFVAWVVVSIIWAWITMIIAGFYPLVDGREAIKNVFLSLRQSKSP